MNMRARFRKGLIGFSCCLKLKKWSPAKVGVSFAHIISTTENTALTSSTTFLLLPLSCTTYPATCFFPLLACCSSSSAVMIVPGGSVSFTSATHCASHSISWALRRRPARFVDADAVSMYATDFPSVLWISRPKTSRRVTGRMK
jgi:hypothetical protein